MHRAAASCPPLSNGSPAVKDCRCFGARSFTSAASPRPCGSGRSRTKANRVHSSSPKVRMSRVRSPKVVNIHDFRSLARRRLPKVVFDYLDGGAEDEISLRANRRAFEEITFRPRHAVAFPECDLR